MIKIKDYVRVGSLEEAYELNQKRSACILGGMLWTKMGQRQVQTAIDLSGLGLDQIEETEEEFSIGCMVTLRQMEEHEGLNAYTDGAARESVRSIVGVQFRNLATVGGSIFGRFGFSDVLTLFLALDTEVELVHAGRMPLAEFACSKRDRDVLVRLIVKKHEGYGLSESSKFQNGFPGADVCGAGGRRKRMCGAWGKTGKGGTCRASGGAGGKAGGWKGICGGAEGGGFGDF